MGVSVLRLIKNVVEYVSKEKIDLVPAKLRGIYALYEYNKKDKSYDLVYIGMARGKKTGIKGRLKKHSKQKHGLWSHFSVYAVWDNIREDEVEELEGLFRHLFRYDSKANRLNRQKAYKKLGRLRQITLKEWQIVKETKNVYHP